MGRDETTKRQTTLSKGMRVVDEDTRKQVQLKRLNALEADNYQEETFNEEEEDEEEDGAPKKKKAKSGYSGGGRSTVLRRKPKNLERLLDEERYAKGGSCDYDRVACGPSTVPRRHFCSVCGQIGQYSCTRCGSRFCSVRCNTNHKDTRCLKFSL